MTTEELKKVLEDHVAWLKISNEGKRADLCEADLREADLDFSCFPLWCGGTQLKVDIRLVYQLLAHVYSLNCDSSEFVEIQKAIKGFAIKSHRANECGVLLNDEESKGMRLGMFEPGETV